MTLTIDAADIFDESYPPITYFQPEPAACFHEAIFSNPRRSWPFSRNATHDKTNAHEKADTVYRSALGKVKPMDNSGGSISVGVQANWGGGNGPNYSGYMKGEYHDDNGNKVEAKVEQKSDGTGTASVYATHDEDNNEDN